MDLARAILMSDNAQRIERALVALIAGCSGSAATLGTRLHPPGTVPIGVGQVRSDQLEGA